MKLQCWEKKPNQTKNQPPNQKQRIKTSFFQRMMYFSFTFYFYSIHEMKGYFFQTQN